MKTFLIVAAVSPLARDAMSIAMIADIPGLTIVRHDMEPDRPGELKRTIATATGVAESCWLLPDDPCPTCGLAEDVLRTAAAVPPGPVAFVLPVGAATAGLARRLTTATEAAAPLAASRFAGVTAVCDPATFEHDLLGDDLLRERGQHLYEGDDRSVGEVLASITEHADFVVTLDGDHERGSALIDLIRADDSHRMDDLMRHDLSAMFQHTHHPAAGHRRFDPLCVPESPKSGAAGAWRMTLSTDRPFHPSRLRRHLTELGGGRIRSRGHFWLPTRPFTACAWDGAGGQLSIGPLDDWRGTPPGTRLSFVGVGPGRDQVVAAFDDAVVTAAEESAEWSHWMEVTDDFDPWLGERG